MKLLSSSHRSRVGAVHRAFPLGEPLPEGPVVSAARHDAACHGGGPGRLVRAARLPSAVGVAAPLRHPGI